MALHSHSNGSTGLLSRWNGFLFNAIFLAPSLFSWYPVVFVNLGFYIMILPKMSHHIYHTEGFVLASGPAQEANKMLYVFTKELGVVHAFAQGIRLLKSKLRYSLQDFSYANISLVRGKDIWRVTNASPVISRFPNIFSQPECFGIYVKVLTLLRRLLNGEEKNESLFILITQAFDFLETVQVKDFQPLSFECMLVLQILHNLGYGSQHSAFEKYASSVVWSRELIISFEPHRSRALAEINTSLRESHL